MRTHTCTWCRTVFTRKIGKRNRGIYCSRACAFTDKDGWRRARGFSAKPERVCVCGAKPPKYKRYCSPGCRPVHAYQPRKPRESQCHTCHMPMTVHMGAMPYWCSLACRKASPEWRARITVTRRDAKALRRARRKRVAYERVYVIKVFERDGWRCQLCGCATPPRLRGQMVDRAPELDHIVPLSAGGSHTWDNVQCACRKCNGLKGAKPQGQQRLSLYVATT